MVNRVRIGVIALVIRHLGSRCQSVEVVESAGPDLKLRASGLRNGAAYTENSPNVALRRKLEMSRGGDGQLESKATVVREFVCRSVTKCCDVSRIIFVCQRDRRVVRSSRELEVTS